MRRLILLILALATLLPSLAYAYDVLILQSGRNPAYEEALKGFRAGTGVSQRLIRTIRLRRGGCYQDRARGSSATDPGNR